MHEDYEAGVMIAIGNQDTYHVLPPRLKEKNLHTKNEKTVI